MTGQALISNALRDVGVLGEGETASADSANEGLILLQNFIDSLGAKRQMLFARQRSVLPLVSGQQSYTIGTGGNLNIARPQFIDVAKCLQTSTGGTVLETPVHILTEREYADIGVKAITTAIVTAIFYDYGWTAGLARIVVYPYPNVSGLSLVLYFPVAVTGFADLSTDYTFAPGYAEALEWNLAIRLSIRYPQQSSVSPDLKKLAKDSLQAILSANARPEVLMMDPALTSRRGRGNSYYGVLGGIE